MKEIKLVTEAVIVTDEREDWDSDGFKKLTLKKKSENVIYSPASA